MIIHNHLVPSTGATEVTETREPKRGPRQCRRFAEGEGQSSRSGFPSRDRLPAHSQHWFRQEAVGDSFQQ